MKKILALLTALVFSLGVNAQLNVTLRSNLSYNGQSLANIGGYVDSTGNEYALVGYSGGLDIVNVTDPDNPFVAFTVPGTTNNWREVKTWLNYAYVTTEGCCNGLQIVNLGYLPDSISYQYWNGSGAIAGQLNTIHALHIDDGHAYLFGSNLFNGAAIIADLSDPWNPVYKGHTPGSYIHDGYVRNNILWSGHIYDGFFSVFDVSDKSNPVLLATQLTPTQFTHNTWLNDNGSVLFTTDENSNSFLGAYDITDLNNIRELDRIQVTPGSGSIVHNTHTINDYEVVSWYKDGIAIVDVSRPDNMIVTGTFDTYLQGSGNGFSGCWGVYPYLPSGTIVASDINNGLFVLTPNYVRGCYLEGLVTDSATGSPLNNVTVTILGPSITDNTKLTGEYKTGTATAGTYDVQFSKSGYVTKIINGVFMQNGVVNNLNVQLSTVFPTITVTGTVTEAGTGNPIQGASVYVANSQFDYTLTTDLNGEFTATGFFGGVYDITVGHWGHRTTCINSQNINGTSPLQFSLAKGYYDDFSLDFGWGVSGPSGNVWERGVPIATTTNQGATANPGNDVSGDCGSTAMITDNGGGGAWDNDVDQGSTILTSPVFDLTGYVNPVITYDRWFYNGGLTNGLPDDSMKIFISNGLNTVPVELLGPSASSSQWQTHGFQVASLIAPTATMQLIVDVGDPGPVFNIVEGGLDKFEVTSFVGLQEDASVAGNLSAYPNPFNNTVRVRLPQEVEIASIEAYDIHGKLCQSFRIAADEKQVEIGQDWSAGLYQVRAIGPDGRVYQTRVVKR